LYCGWKNKVIPEEVMSVNDVNIGEVLLYAPRWQAEIIYCTSVAYYMLNLDK
jgi:hypothetical protein